MSAAERPIANHFVSVDVETAGPTPRAYSLLAIGACMVTEPARSFYVELRPESDRSEPEAMAVHGLSLDRLRREGLPLGQAMFRFEAWLLAEIPAEQPVFVGLNAAFDWMFVADAFQRALGRNPFGHRALDILSLYVGLTGASWTEATATQIFRRYLPDRIPTHHALEDAQAQAEVFRRMLQEPTGDRPGMLE